MALIIKDRVKEITTSTGTGAVSLGGASATFDAFQSVMSNGDTTYYAIVHTASGTDEWEVGLGTWNTGNTLTRTTVLAGSNGTSAVTFSSGNKDVFMTYPADKAVFFNADGDVDLNRDPQTALQAATKQYVDTIAAAGIHYHTPVRVEAPSNLTATYDNGTSGVGATLTNSGTQAALVIDGITLATSDRVLVYNQTNAAHNGIYTVTNTGSASTNWVLTRATDADTYGASDPDALGEGDAYFVKEGDTGAGELYVMNTSGVITFGTTNITFTVIAETAVYSAGNGLTLTGTQFAVGAGTGVTVNANNVAIGQAVGTSDSPTFAGLTVGDGHTIGNDVGDNLTLTSSNAENIIYNSNAGTHAFKANGTSTVTFDGSGNITVTGTVDGRDVAADGTKLDGIESGATADQTASEILTALLGVDGASSNLDADLLDGQHGSYYLSTTGTAANASLLNNLASTQFLRSDADDTFTGTLTVDGLVSVGNSSPKTWNSNSTGVIQFGAVGALENYNATDDPVIFSANQYRASDGNFKYIETNEASRMTQYAGEFYFQTAPSGTADTNATFSTRLMVKNTGNVGINTESPSAKLHILSASSGANVDALFIHNSATAANTSSTLRFANSTDITSQYGQSKIVGVRTTSGGSSDLVFHTANEGTLGEAMRIKNDNDLEVQGNVSQGGNTVLDTSTTFGGDISGTYDAIVVANDSHNHQFNNLTNKTSGTGEYSTSSYLTAGRGNGGVSLTHNDGYGNANVTFNHKDGTPEQNGKTARIAVNTDNTTTDAGAMQFHLDSGTSGVAATSTERMRLTETGRLGINIISPSETLDVGGNIAVSGTVDGVDIAGSIDQAVLTTSSPTFSAPSVTDLYLADQIIHTGDTNTYLQFHNNDQFRVVCNGSEQIEVGNGFVLMNDNKTFRMGTGSDYRQYFNGTDMVFRNYAHAGGDFYFQGEGSDGVNRNAIRCDYSGANAYAVLYYSNSEVLTTESTYGPINKKAGSTNGLLVGNAYASDSQFHGIRRSAAGTNDYIIVQGDTDLNTYVQAGSGSDVYMRPNGQNQARFDANGYLYVLNGIVAYNDTNTYLDFNAADSFRIVTGGGERFAVNNNYTSCGALFVNAAIAEDYEALSGTTPTCNATNAGYFSLTMTGNTTFTFSTPWTTTDSIGFVLELTGNGGTVTWPTSVEWAGGTAPDAPASGETDLLVFNTRDGGTTWYGMLAIDAAA